MSSFLSLTPSSSFSGHSPYLDSSSDIPVPSALVSSNNPSVRHPLRIYNQIVHNHLPLLSQFAPEQVFDLPKGTQDSDFVCTTCNELFYAPVITKSGIVQCLADTAPSDVLLPLPYWDWVCSMIKVQCVGCGTLVPFSPSCSTMIEHIRSRCSFLCPLKCNTQCTYSTWEGHRVSCMAQKVKCIMYSTVQSLGVDLASDPALCRFEGTRTQLNLHYDSTLCLTHHEILDRLGRHIPHLACSQENKVANENETEIDEEESDPEHMFKEIERDRKRPRSVSTQSSRTTHRTSLLEVNLAKDTEEVLDTEGRGWNRELVECFKKYMEKLSPAEQETIMNKQRREIAEFLYTFKLDDEEKDLYNRAQRQDIHIVPASISEFVQKSRVYCMPNRKLSIKHV
jgi:hypothetical protein